MRYDTYWINHGLPTERKIIKYSSSFPQFDMASLIDDQVQRQMKSAAKEHEVNARRRRMTAFPQPKRWYWNSGNSRRPSLLWWYSRKYLITYLYHYFPSLQSIVLPKGDLTQDRYSHLQNGLSRSLVPAWVAEGLDSKVVCRVKEYVTETVQDFVSEICPFVLTINSSLWFFSYRHSKQLMYHFKICPFFIKMWW